MDSILISVKKMLGIVEEYDHYDMDIIIHINSVFSILNQIGVGPPEGFSIEDEDATWGDFVSDLQLIECVKSYVYLRVRMLFDPPTTSFNLESFKNIVSELEWRMAAIMDSANVNAAANLPEEVP